MNRKRRCHLSPDVALRDRLGSRVSHGDEVVDPGLPVDGFEFHHEVRRKTLRHSGPIELVLFIAPGEPGHGQPSCRRGLLLSESALGISREAKIDFSGFSLRAGFVIKL